MTSKFKHIFLLILAVFLFAPATLHASAEKGDGEKETMDVKEIISSILVTDMVGKCRLRISIEFLYPL